MLKSMTGYGRAEATIGNKKFTVEIKSLNSTPTSISIAALKPFLKLVLISSKKTGPKEKLRTNPRISAVVIISNIR